MAMFRVAQATYRAAPLAIIVQLTGSVITAVLPIVTTYFAARATTALAEAYAGNHAAGEQVLVYVGITAVLGVVMTAWQSLESYVTQLMRYRVEAAMTDRMYEHFHEIDFWRYDDKKTADMYDKAQQFARFFPYIFDRLASIDAVYHNGDRAYCTHLGKLVAGAYCARSGYPGYLNSIPTVTCERKALEG